jgi:hypothetical protein
VLRKIGICNDDIHVEFSGSKGYHVWLLIDDTLPIKRLVAFGKWVISQMGDYSDKIELRPESISGKGIRLPMGLHQGSGKWSRWVDHQLQPFADQDFLSIQPMQKDTLNNIITDALTIREVRTLERRPIGDVDDWLEEADRQLGHIKPPIRHNSALRKYAERLIKSGISEDDLAQGHGRHYAQFFVACLFKENGYDQSDVIEMTTQWALRERASGRSDSNESTIRRDIKKNVRQIFKYDLGLYDSQGRPFEVFKSDVMFTQQFFRANVRRVLWALVIYYRIYGKEDGTFWIAWSDIQLMIGAGPNTVQKYLKMLIDDGTVELVETGKWNGGKGKASVYRIPALKDSGEDEGELVMANTYVELFNNTYSLISA